MRGSYVATLWVFGVLSSVYPREFWQSPCLSRHNQRAAVCYWIGLLSVVPASSACCKQQEAGFSELYPAYKAITCEIALVRMLLSPMQAISENVALQHSISAYVTSH